MNQERWQKVKVIAADALDIAAADRAAFVAQACGADEPLREEVMSLLGADDPTGRFLEFERPPERVGPWRIVHELGRGGMGTVYLAERADGQFEQRVAVKIVTRGMDSAAIVRRFHAERQILARLDHPNISRLIDGGVTDDGRPYFVMELVEGVPFLQYCREHQASIAKRIELFNTVCDAVEHAHRHLILHRDIKAENVLVDANGKAKLVDFGIARLLDPEGQPGSSPTEAGNRVLTPQCCSPEQMRGESLTTASDIYSLGLLLYEALADRPAYEVGGLPFAEQVRVVCDVQPRRPSEVAPAAVARRLRGDLDNIVLKAIDKDPSRRYARAAELAADLQRFLDGRPVAAKPATMFYRARKYSRRHWRGLAVAGAATIVVAVAVSNALVQGRRAQRRFDDVRAMATSFMFEFHDAIARLPGATPARELVVTRALQYLDGLAREASGDPGLIRELAQSYEKVGDVQGLYYENNLGQIPQARISYEKAIALFGQLAQSSPDDPRAKAELTQATLRLASTYQVENPARARELLNDARHILPPEDDPAKVAPALRTITALVHIGVAENALDTPQESLDERNRAIDLLQRALADNPRDEDAARWLSVSFKRRAALLLGPMKDPARAMADLSAGLATDEARVARDPSNAVAQLDLALGESYRSMALGKMGNLDGAVAALDRAITIRNRIVDLDPRNVRVAEQLSNDNVRMADLQKELAAHRVPTSTGSRR